MSDWQHVNVKLRVDEPGDAALDAMIPVFHGWIQDRLCPEQLVDVADYRHVPAGPGVVLIGHQANYSLDGAAHQWSVRYNRKADVGADAASRLEQATRAALEACQRLEADPRLAGRVRFNGRQIEFTANDRMLAPNDPATRAALAPALDAFCRRLFAGASFTLDYEPEPRRLFSAAVTTSAAFTPAALLRNLDTQAPA